MVTKVRQRLTSVQETKITVHKSGLLEEDNESVIDVRKFETEPAYVRVNVGVTRNMGNYESLRLDIAVTAPCYVEEVDEVAAALGDKVNILLDAELEKYTDNEEE